MIDPTAFLGILAGFMLFRLGRELWVRFRSKDSNDGE